MIIAINGNDSGGKDTLAKLLFLQLNQNENSLSYFDTLPESIYKNGDDYSVVAFADAVAEQYKYFTGVDYRELGRETKDLHRPKFSLFAENMKTLFGSDVWVKKVDLTKNIIIPDLRFKVELGSIMNHPSYTIKIERKNTKSYINELLDYVRWDRVVHNNSTIEDLIKESKLIYQDLKENYGI